MTDLAEFNSATNYVHLPVNFPPKVALSRLVNSPKDVPSRRPRQEYPELRQPYRKANRLWSGPSAPATRPIPAPSHPPASPARYD